MEENRLQDIPQFRTLEENLELRKALQMVDKLTAKNIELRQELDKFEEALMEMPGVIVYPSEEEKAEAKESENAAREVEAEKPYQDSLNKHDLLDDDDLDFTPPSYEDVVDPEFDRGFDMAYDQAIDDIIKYLKSIRSNGGA